MSDLLDSVLFPQRRSEPFSPLLRPVTLPCLWQHSQRPTERGTRYFAGKPYHWHWLKPVQAPWSPPGILCYVTVLHLVPGEDREV